MLASYVEFGYHRRSWFSPILNMFTGVLGKIWAKVSDRKVAPINAEQGCRYGLEAAGISHHSFPLKALQIQVLQPLTLLRSFPLDVPKCGSILTHSGAKVQTFLSGPSSAVRLFVPRHLIGMSYVVFIMFFLTNPEPHSVYCMIIIRHINIHLKQHEDNSWKLYIE